MKLSVPRPKKTVQENPTTFQKLQSELNLNQSYFSLILGLLVVLIGGVLLFNYLKTTRGSLGPSQQTSSPESVTDVNPNNLPGKYTVKEGDTLFTIAQNYYQDGSKFSEIVKANSLNDENSIATGQILEIPKLSATAAQEKTEPTPTPAPTEVKNASDQNSGSGTGGAENQTIWGEKITANTYTVVEGDWLSKISGRAYGDVLMYKKLAEANNISNPDLIFPGQVLKLPR